MAALSSLKILDFSTLLPGPFGTLMLADLGAQVLRVEAPGRLELTREMGEKDGDSAYLHRYLNRSKKSLGLDLKKPEAVRIIKRLVMDYDIVVEQFRPGVMDKFGLGYDDLKAVNPRLIYCSLTGYGQTGPYRDRAGHDNNYLALAGIQDHSRRRGHAPVPAGIQIADLAGGSLHLVAGLLAAVIQRTDTGQGQYIDISMTDAAFTLNAIPVSSYLGAGVETGPEQELLNGGQFYDYYETSDGRYFSVGGLEPKFKRALCAALERPDLVETAFSTDPEQQQDFKRAIAASFKSMNYAECLALFKAVDACVEPVLTLGEACQNEQLLSRNMVVEVDGIKQVGCAIKMSESPQELKFKGCALGEHNDLLMTEFGYTEDEMREFKEAGTFGR
ncbi:MAG: CoA transferase [Alphaproteobacteria bacterium]|nr:CoA transferase [Alphaproteobacteria bacterium]